jgi:hypothetical protein
VLIYKLFTLYVFVQTLACGCGPDRRRGGFEVNRSEYTVRRIARLPKDLPESSGLALAADGHLWTHQDSGHENILFKITKQSEVLQRIRVPGTSNIDWEDLARDTKGHIYIGDFGNNANQRRNLRIFKVGEQTLTPVDTIQFAYADQQAFPPAKPHNNFDAEAFFWVEDKLFIVSKNRNVKAPARVYAIPDVPGQYSVSPTDSVLVNAMITGADLDPGLQQVVLLGYGKLYLFEFEEGGSMFGGRRICIPVARSGQAEAVVFLPDNDILFTNEGGKIFKVSKKIRKDKQKKYQMNKKKPS